MRYRGGRIAQKLKTQRERERYRARKHIGEPPFGWSKSVLVTRPIICTTTNERVYITAWGCEIGLGGRSG